MRKSAMVAAFAGVSVIGLLATSGSAQCYTTPQVIISGTNGDITDALTARFSTNPLDPERLFLRSGGNVQAWSEYQASTRRVIPLGGEDELLVMDFDGAGGQGARLVRVAGFPRVVETFDGSSWSTLPAPGGALPVVLPSPNASKLPLLISWDHDGNPATAARLMAVTNAGSGTGLYEYVTGANPGWQKALSLGFANSFDENRRIALTTADIDGAGSGPNRLYISRVGGTQDVLAVNPDYSTTSFPHPVAGSPVAPAQLITLDPDGAGPLPTTLYAQGVTLFGSSMRLFRFDPAGFDGLFWIDLGQIHTSGTGFGSRSWTMRFQVGDPDEAGPLGSTILAFGTGRRQSWRYESATNTWALNSPTSGPLGLVRTWDNNPGVTPPLDITGDSAGLYKRTGSSWSEIEAWPSTNVFDQSYAFVDLDGAGPNPGAYYVAGAMLAYGLQDFAGGQTYRVVRVNPNGSATLIGSPYLGGTGELVVAGGQLFITSTGGGSPNPVQWLNPATNLWQSLPSTLRTGIAWDADGSGPLPERFTTVSGANIQQWNGSAMMTVATVPNFATTTGFDLRAITLWDADGTGPNPPRLVVGGVRQRPAGNVGYIGVFDGTSWQTVGDLGTGVSFTAPNLQVLNLSSWDQDGPGPLPPRLLVGPISGGSSGASSVLVSNIGAWTGSTWINLAMPQAFNPLKLFSWDPDGPGSIDPLVVASQSVTQTLNTWSNGVTTSWGLTDPVPGNGPTPRFVHSTVNVDSTGRQALLLSYANERLVSLVCPAAVPCLADVAGANQSVGADGSLTADDIIVFLGWFFASDTRADVAGANQSPGPDTQFTADDIIVFLGAYFAGCP